MRFSSRSDIENLAICVYIINIIYKGIYYIIYIDKISKSI